jgi:hypothetical protein
MGGVVVRAYKHRRAGMPSAVLSGGRRGRNGWRSASLTTVLWFLAFVLALAVAIAAIVL